MRIGCWRFLFTGVVLAGVFCQECNGGNLRKVWEIDLSKAIKSIPDQKDLPVLAIRFSPNGRQIAAGVTRYLPGGKSMSTLLVAQTASPDNPKEFPIKGIAWDSFHAEVMPAIMWSPSGETITAGYSVVRASDGRTCELESVINQGFISADRIVATERQFGPTKLDFFDLDCRLGETWSVGRKLDVDDISIYRGLVYTYEGEPSLPKGEILILDPAAKHVVKSWPTAGGGSGVRFAEGGKAVCGGGSARVSVWCSDVDTGAAIAESDKIHGGLPIFAADRASRIVAHDYASVLIPFTRGEYGEVLKRRVVWDYRSGKELASWAPETQEWINSGMRVREQFRVAISPEGRYVAEGGNGWLRLYEIEP